jgi:FMN phosphatase YigB (HAD superfamily)
MKPPKVVVFDLGKVLVDFDYGIATSRIAERSGRTKEELHALVDQTPLLHRLESGKINNQQFFEEVRTAVGYPGTYEEFAVVFGDIFTPIPEMVDLHAQLRQRGVRTFIFSNTNDFAVSHIRAQFPFFNQFDAYILSFEHGCMKPEVPIYEVVERMTSSRGADVLYIDDRTENIVTGNARGWHTIEHTDPKVTRQRVADLGLLG